MKFDNFNENEMNTHCNYDATTKQNRFNNFENTFLISNQKCMI